MTPYPTEEDLFNSMEALYYWTKPCFYFIYGDLPRQSRGVRELSFWIGKNYQFPFNSQVQLALPQNPIKLFIHACTYFKEIKSLKMKRKEADIQLKRRPLFIISERGKELRHLIQHVLVRWIGGSGVIVEWLVSDVVVEG